MTRAAKEAWVAATIARIESGTVGTTWIQDEIARVGDALCSPLDADLREKLVAYWRPLI